MGCANPRLQKWLLREVNLNLLKAFNICRTAKAIKKYFKLLQVGIVRASSSTAVCVVNNASGISIKDKIAGFHCCRKKYSPKAVQCMARRVVLVVISSVCVGPAKVLASQLIASWVHKKLLYNCYQWAHYWLINCRVYLLAIIVNLLRANCRRGDLLM